MYKVKEWLVKTPYAGWGVEVASEDASFRRYFRLRSGDKTRIVMDASLEKEALIPFLDVTQRLLASGVKAPVITSYSIHYTKLYEDVPIFPPRFTSDDFS